MEANCHLLRNLRKHYLLYAELCNLACNGQDLRRFLICGNALLNTVPFVQLCNKIHALYHMLKAEPNCIPLPIRSKGKQFTIILNRNTLLNKTLQQFLPNANYNRWNSVHNQMGLHCHWQLCAGLQPRYLNICLLIVPCLIALQVRRYGLQWQTIIKYLHFLLQILHQKYVSVLLY